MAALAPANLAAVALGVFGLGLTASSFLGARVATLRLVLGILLIVAALITAGLNLLMRHGAATRPTEDA